MNMRSFINLIESAVESRNHFSAEAIAQVLADSRVSSGLQIKPSTRFWRGTSYDSGHGMAVYGLGFYVTADRTVAKQYAGHDGEVVEVGKYDLPDNPLRFKSVNDFQIWYGQSLKSLDIPSKIEVGQMFPDFADFIRALDPTVDGLQIGIGKSAIFVTYPVRG